MFNKDAEYRAFSISASVAMTFPTLQWNTLPINSSALLSVWYGKGKGSHSQLDNLHLLPFTKAPPIVAGLAKWADPSDTQQCPHAHTDFWLLWASWLQMQLHSLPRTLQTTTVIYIDEIITSVQTPLRGAEANRKGRFGFDAMPKTLPWPRSYLQTGLKYMPVVAIKGCLDMAPLHSHLNKNNKCYPTTASEQQPLGDGE